MPLPITFAALASPVPLADLDLNFAAVAKLGTIPATVTGTNALTLTLATDTPTIAAYANYLRFSGIAAGDSSSTVTAQVGALAALSVYKDGLNGPEVLSGGEIQAGALVILTYDSALNSGAGGFHLETGASAVLRGQSLAISALSIGAFALFGSIGTVSGSFYFSLSSLTTLTNRGHTSLNTAFISGPATLASLNATTLMVGGSLGTMSAMITAQRLLAFSVAGTLGSSDVTTTLSGVSLGDYVVIAPPVAAMAVGLAYSGWVPAAGSVNVRQLNASGVTLATINATFGITALRIT